jgi:REP element-mobilizing transposase RayT
MCESNLSAKEDEMRQARLKPDYQDTWHHCYNRTVGTRSDRPFGDAEKEMFVRLLKRLAAFYSVRVVSYTFMSNHFHIILQAPLEAPSEEDASVRYAAFHRGKREIRPGTAICREWTGRLRDVSWFMRHFQHLCTAWYNRTRPERRRGPLWAGRFKNTVLESGLAVWACWAYVERNPVRAHLVTDPADYRFSSYGEWAQTGHHPFADAIARYLVPTLPLPFEGLDASGILHALKDRFARDAAEDAAQKGNPAVSTPCEFLLTARRRVRHWVDGLCIGSELFVREAVSRARPSSAKPKHRLAKASPTPDAPDAICCWRRLRLALE